MAEFIIVDGDIATFSATFGTRTVVSVPSSITGSGDAAINNKAVCIEGDEDSLNVKNVIYTDGAFSIPGKGDITLKKATGVDGVSSKKTVLTAGKSYDAEFTVTQPAKQPMVPPAPPVDDPNASPTLGSATFAAPANSFVTAG
jgi:hypothetical protein